MTEDEVIEEMVKSILAHLSLLTPEQRAEAMKRGEKVMERVRERVQYH